LVQRRSSILRHAAPRQPRPVPLISSASCNRCQPSEQKPMYFRGTHQELCGIALQGVWTVHILVAGNAKPRCGHHRDPASLVLGWNFRVYGSFCWSKIGSFKYLKSKTPNQNSTIKTQGAPPPPSQHAPSPKHSYRVLGVDVRLRRQKSANLRVPAPKSSVVQRRTSILRHAAPRQPRPVPLISSASCNRCQPSEHKPMYFRGTHQELCGIALQGVWTVHTTIHPPP
jgi:CDGSH-type Zn-finger protein